MIETYHHGGLRFHLVQKLRIGREPARGELCAELESDRPETVTLHRIAVHEATPGAEQVKCACETSLFSR